MKIYIYFIFSVLVFLSCANPKEKPNNFSAEIGKTTQARSNAGLELMQKHCYICHSPESSSHDEIIAPPMAAVKMRYKRSFKSEQEFVDALVRWTMNPKEENALMKGAIERFNIMPKQLFDENEMKQVAVFIYQNKLSEPNWFAAHQKEMHGNGRKKGQDIP